MQIVYIRFPAGKKAENLSFLGVHRACHKSFVSRLENDSAIGPAREFFLESLGLQEHLLAIEHHLRARFHKIKLRVLHPGISARHTVDILRGLPEGSCLSPTLFGIFVADLVHELRTKFPHAVIHLGHSPPHPHPSIQIYNAYLDWRSTLC